MATQIWAPDEEDEVVMKDGTMGKIDNSEDIVWEGGDKWEVTVAMDSGDVEENVGIKPDESKQGGWLEY